MSSPFIPIILSGGSGSRLWPVSRKEQPKPFMRLSDGATLAGKTLERAIKVTGAKSTLTVTGQMHEQLTRAAYSEVDFEGEHQFLLEPFGRNTAPAIATAAAWVSKHHGPDAVMLVLPSDHLISDLDAFHMACQSAYELALGGHLVCLGVQPSHADTGFGYIKCGNPLRGSASSIAKFVEKPDLATAQSFLEAGGYLWNAGMFCFTAQAVLSAFEEQAPDIYGQLKTLVDHPEAFSEQGVIDPELFSPMPSISFDYAVMEKVNNSAVVPVSCGWSDIGSWSAFKAAYPEDDAGNASNTETVLIDCENIFAFGSKRLITAVGVKDLVIIETEDAILVAHTDNSQDVKRVVEQLEASGSDVTIRYGSH
jgi:mannose-1-phosphate guanylyltransferase